MAEGLINHFLGRAWQAYSAGTSPSGIVHPLAIEAMRELGIDISQNESKHVDVFRTLGFDYVITVCDDAAENCPIWLGKGRVSHMGFPDPARATGTYGARMSVFRQVRDDIRQQLLPYLEQQV
jgi:arsenate reductase